MNAITLIDGYKFSHEKQYPRGTTRVYSNWTPRESRVAGIENVVFFGLQYFLDKYLGEEFGAFFTFWRAWYYWVVEGPMPLDVARKLWADPVGKRDIRVTGHCGCPSPDEPPWAAHYDANGKRLAFDRGGEEPAQFDSMIAKGFLKQADKDKYVFVPDPAAAAVTSFIESYHVDSELGLYILAQAIRGLP